MITGIIIKLLLGLLTLLILTRWMGKKELSQANPVYFINVVLLAGLVEETIYDDKVHWYHMLIGIAVMVVFSMAVEKLTYKYPTLERIIKGQKEPLLINGKVNERLKRREQLTDQDIDTLLREHHIFNREEVDTAYLETNGKLTVKKKG